MGGEKTKSGGWWGHSSFLWEEWRNDGGDDSENGGSWHEVRRVKSGGRVTERNVTGTLLWRDFGTNLNCNECRKSVAWYSNLLALDAKIFNSCFYFTRPSSHAACLCGRVGRGDDNLTRCEEGVKEAVHHREKNKHIGEPSHRASDSGPPLWLHLWGKTN